MPEYYLLQGEVESDLALMKGIFTDYSAVSRYNRGVRLRSLRTPFGRAA